VDISALDRFVNYVFGDEEEANVKPIFEDEGVSFVYIQHSNVYSTTFAHCFELYLGPDENPSCCCNN
jgi:hypothetical protein